MELKETLSNLQKECDVLYKEYGATDEVIQLQVAINTLINYFYIHF